MGKRLESGFSGSDEGIFRANFVFRQRKHRVFSRGFFRLGTCVFNRDYSLFELDFAIAGGSDEPKEEFGVEWDTLGWTIWTFSKLHKVVGLRWK